MSPPGRGIEVGCVLWARAFERPQKIGVSLDGCGLAVVSERERGIYLVLVRLGIV